MSNQEFYTLNCRGQVLSLNEPIIMGILNITPDSFSDGGKYTSTDAAVNHACHILNEGAAIIDIGGYSSRPGADDISVDEECSRVLPVIKALRQAVPDAILSVDTFRSEVARQCLEAGVHIINDISGGELDPEMIPMVARWGNVPYIAMHMQGRPQTMQTNPQYEDIVNDIWTFFVRKLNQLNEAGITDVVLDPGFGFGKTIDHNYLLLSGFGQFRQLDKPLLAGVSRKSMIYKVIGGTPEEADIHTQVLHQITLQKGADILRVHHVGLARQTISLFQRMNAHGAI